jgi:hypothetical protein
MKEKHEVIYTFIKSFIGFEVKLKRLNYFKKSVKRKNVEVDWDSFEKDYREVILVIANNSDKHTKYLLTNPPKKMCVKDNLITFDRTVTDDAAKELMISLRAIRNNLFHGGKFDGEELSGSERNMTLLKSAIFVLRKFELEI